MRHAIARCVGESLGKKRRTSKRLRDSAVILGAVGLAASAGVLATAGSALAAVGTVPGGLQLIQAGVTLGASGGPLTTTTTWNSTTACPAGFQTSANITEWTTTGTEISSISPVTGVGLSGPNFTGSLQGTPGAILNSAGIKATSPGTVEWVIGCYSGASATGSVTYTGSLFVTVVAGATNFIIGTGGPVIATTTTNLIASPNPVAVGATVTLNAAVAGTGGTGGASPAGSVQFENCPTPSTCTNINAAVAVNTGGTAAPASTTTSFSAAGNVNLAAVFTPTNTTGVAGSTGTASLAVGSLLAGGTNPVSINVTVPQTGTFSVTVSPGSVTLTPASLATTPDETATGTLNNVTVNDSRNTFPGWSVSGQESVFTGSGTNTIPANSLGWTPAFVGSAVDGAVIGSPVAPVGANTGSTGPGLGTAAVLGYSAAGCGFGTNVMNAALLLDIPSTAPPGAYAGTLTVTYIETQPTGVAACVPVGVTF